MKKSRDILEDNYQCSEGSFIYNIHEAYKFDKDSFWDYYNAIKELSVEALACGIEKEISIKITHTYCYILSSFMYHFAPNDSYKIKNFPKRKYNLYVERLRLTVEGYFSGHIIDEASFSAELLNPKYKRLNLKLVKS